MHITKHKQLVELRKELREIEKRIDDVMADMSDDGDMSRVQMIGDRNVTAWKNADKANRTGL